MSVAKNPKPRRKTDENVQVFYDEAQNVGSKQNDVSEETHLRQPKQIPSSKDRFNNNILNTKKKDFVIPRKKKQAKELLQSHRFDSRETKELLRSVQLTLRDPTFWSSYRFDRVEFVNNDKLSRKYGEKKQALRFENLRTNVEDRFAFFFTTSRAEVKSICEHGLRTGNSSLTSLGDPNLGVYVCRFADVISKRPLTTEDTGYLLVFRVVKGKVRFIGGSNPELQPTPNHDCHVSKSLTTLSSKASHSDVFESSQLYFYEIDENSEDFHSKYPRQVLPYAVLSFSIIKSSERQLTKLDEKTEGKKAVATGYDFPSSADENILSSPNRIESIDDVISSANVSWSGVLAINKKQLAYVDFLSYSRKKHPLPVNIDYFDICQKVSHKDLKSLLKCPVFRNGKPASSGVCIELNHGRKFIYYEVRVVNQIQEKFDEIVSHFVETETAGVIEYPYFKGPVYLYFIPTSKLTNDIGITDRKSPLALHVLVQVRHIRRLPSPEGTAPNDQEQEQDAGVDDTSLNEAVIKSQVQEIFKKKYQNKQEKQGGKTKQNKMSPLLNRTISLDDGKSITDKPKGVLERRRKSTDAKLTLLPDGASHEKRVQYQKDAQNWVDNFFSSGRKEKHSNMEKQESTSSNNTLTRKSKYKWVSPRLIKESVQSETDSHNDGSIKTSRNEKENIPSKNTSNTDQGMPVEQASVAQPVHGDQDLGRNEGLGVSLNNTATSSLPSEKAKFEIDFLSVQKLIKEFKHLDKQGQSTVVTKSSGLADPRLKRRSSSSSSQDNNPDKPNTVPPIPPSLPPPPIPPPPPPPPPMSPFLPAPLPSYAAVGSTPVSMATTAEPSSTTAAPLFTFPVSPPAVKRQEMVIPGLEPTGSPVFQLMKEKISFLNQSICTSCSYLTDNVISAQSVTAWNQKHPSSPITFSSSNSTPNTAADTPVSISNSRSYTTGSENKDRNQELETRASYSREDSPKVPLSPPASNHDSADKCAAESDGLDSDIPGIPGYNNIVINRPLTEAEKNSSRAIQKIKNILFQNSVKNTLSEDENSDAYCPNSLSGISRILKVQTEKDLKQEMEGEISSTDELNQGDEGSRKPKEYSKKENIAKEYIIKGIRPIIEDKYVNEKDGRNVNERNNSHKLQVKNMSVDRKTSVGTPDKQLLKLDSESSSPCTPELKNGLELLDNLISSEKRVHQASPLSKSESQRIRSESRGSNNSERRSKSRSRETTPRKERSEEGRQKISPSSKRKVTIKRSKVNENKWDDMTSDISDTELPSDSDGYVTKNHNDEDGYNEHKALLRSKDVSRLSCDGLESTHQHDRYPNERAPNRHTLSIGTKRDSSMDTCRDYRDDHDDWDREWKRRKLDQEFAQETAEPSLHDDESTHSDSAMSISSLDSVSFEYAVPNDESPCHNNYRFVRTSPTNGRSLEVTIRRDAECPDRFPSHTNTDNVKTNPYHTHRIPPSSPIEVNMTASSVMPDSPGTPETAVPSEDFLHTNIGYWSSGMTKEGADILPHDTDDKHFEPIQQETVEESTYRNGRDTWSASSSPYRGHAEDHDGSTVRYEREELVNKKSRGEAYCQRRPSSSGASTGYDYNNICYKDRNQHTDPDYYRTIDHDGHSRMASNHTTPYTDDNYDNLRDMSDIYPDSYSRTRTSDRYDDQGDHKLFYSSGNTYEDTDSPRSVDRVEELGSNERFYTSDRTDSYSTSDRHASPSYIGKRLAKLSSDHRGFFGIFPNDDPPYEFHKGREISDDDRTQRGTVTSSDKQPSTYSPRRSETIDDRYRQRSPLIKNSRSLHCSPTRSRTTGDEYRRGSCSPHISNDRHSRYTSSQHGVASDDNRKRSSLENKQTRSYSPERRGIQDKNYRPWLTQANTDRHSPYSPEHSSGVADDNYVQRSSLQNNESHSRYSPDRRELTDDSYGQRSSTENDERHLQYSPNKRGARYDTGGRRSLYSAYKREISSSDEYHRRSTSPSEFNDHTSRYSPERKINNDDVYSDYYEDDAGNDIEHGTEHRQDYQRNQEFPQDVEEEKDSHFHDDLYQDEDQRTYFSEDEDSGRKRQHRYTFDNEPSYGSDVETFEDDSVDTPEYYDKEKHKYLEDIMENNISETTLALDHTVFDGIRDFPVQLLELAQYYAAKTASDGEVDFNSDGRDLSGNNLAVRHNKGSSSGFGMEGNVQEKESEGGTDRVGMDGRRKKKFGDNRRAFKPIQRKQACFYVYNPDNDSECEAVKHFMLKNGAQFLDVSDERNLKTMTGELRVLVRRKHKQSIHRIRNLFKMKLHSNVKFALFNTVEDVSKKTKVYAAVFQYGGVLIPDDAILRNIDPALLEALLGFMAEQNAMHQKFYWVMNIRYIAYKRLGSQRPLTWRDAYVLGVLRKYRNERFVNIISKDYVLESLSPVQRYLDTALKQQLELMPTYRHFIVLSDLTEQVVEVSWFYNRGIGFMDVRKWLHLFAGEAKTQQLLSASKYTEDGSEYTAEGARHDTLQYDTIDSPEDDESVEPTSMSTAATHISSVYSKPFNEGHHEQPHLARSLSCNMVSRCSNYNDSTNMKEKRLEILSSIKNVKTNLMNNVGAKGLSNKAGIQGSVAKQRQYERSRSYEPRPRVHDERVMPRWANNHRTCDTTNALDNNALPGVKEAQYPKASHEKRASYHGNESHNNNIFKGTMPSTFN